jgi:hypothetical protein
LHENGFEEAHIELQLSNAKKNKVAASYDYAEDKNGTQTKGPRPSSAR